MYELEYADIEQQSNMIDKIMFDLSDVMDMVGIDLESISDPRMVVLVRDGQSRIEKEYSTSIDTLKLYRELDNEGVMGTIFTAIKNFFKAIFKFLKKIIFFWKSDDTDNIDEKEVVKLPFESIDDILKYAYAMNAVADYFKSDMDKYLPALTTAIKQCDNILVKQNLNIIENDMMVVLEDAEYTNNNGAFKRFWKGLTSNSTPELYCQFLGLKKDGSDKYTADCITYQVIDGVITYMVSGNASDDMTVHIDDSVTEEIKKNEKVLISDFIKLFNTINSENNYINLSVKTLEKLEATLNKVEKDTTVLLPTINALTELHEKYKIHDYEDAMGDKLASVFLSEMKSSIKAISSAVKHVTEIKKHGKAIADIIKTEPKDK